MPNETIDQKLSEPRAVGSPYREGQDANTPAWRGRGVSKQLVS